MPYSLRHQALKHNLMFFFKVTSFNRYFLVDELIALWDSIR